MAVHFYKFSQLKSFTLYTYYIYIIYIICMCVSVLVCVYVFCGNSYTDTQSYDLKGHFENIFYVLTWDMGNLGFL